MKPVNNLLNMKLNETNTKYDTEMADRIIQFIKEKKSL